MTGYDRYNREERALCAHLFRLLHENLNSKETTPLRLFLDKLSNKNLIFKNFKTGLTDLHFENLGIYCEVAIIRDAYYDKKKSGVNPFMDELTKIIMNQESITECTLYSDLPEALNKSSKTHPKQIKQKAEFIGIELNNNEKKVFGAMQGMFNAKPDLVITIDNKLLVFEAKFTEPFDELQLKRTENIAEVWTKLLHPDFGFNEPPEYSVIKLGASKFNPHINWSDILSIVEKTYPSNDRTFITLKAGVDLLKDYNLE